MALIKANFEAHGTFGGVYFKRDQYGQHIQAMPRIPSRFSNHKMPVRLMAWTACFTHWKILMTLILLTYWTNFAYEYLYTDRKGNRKKLSNSQWFAHFNVNRIVDELPPYTTPPRTPNWLPDFTCTGGYFFVRDPRNPFNHIPVTGNWYEKGYYNYQPVYEVDTPKLKLWYDGDRWIVSSYPGNKDPGTFWTRFGDGIEGRYIPDNPINNDLTFFK